MKRFSKIYGLIYILMLVLIIGLGDMYINNLRLLSRNKLTSIDNASDTIKKIEDLTFIKGSISPPVDLNKLSVSTPELISKGKSLFETNCVSCHGTEGKGDGIAGKTLNPPPRNFTELNDWKNGQKLSQIFKTISEGISATGMPQFNNLTFEERFSLSHYIRNFRQDFPKDSTADLQMLDNQYSISKGFKQPNQIPVLNSEKIIIKEKKLFYETISLIAQKIKENKIEKVAEVFRKYSFDIKRSLISVFSYPKWNENQIQFVNFLVVDPVEKGFKASITNISEDELLNLYNYIKGFYTTIVMIKN
jgi:mono/diheme cytochrome c family protein